MRWVWIPSCSPWSTAIRPRTGRRNCRLLTGAGSASSRRRSKVIFPRRQKRNRQDLGGVVLACLVYRYRSRPDPERRFEDDEGQIEHQHDRPPLLGSVHWFVNVCLGGAVPGINQPPLGTIFS